MELNRSLGLLSPRLHALADAAPVLPMDRRARALAPTPSSGVSSTLGAPDARRPSPETCAAALQRTRSQDALQRDLRLAQLVPVPPLPRSDVQAPLFQATVAPGTPNATYFPENAVPMTSVLLNSATVNGDGLEPRYIAQAALKANPDAQFIVPTQASYDSLQDPRFVAERARIAERLGVPAAQVVPVRADMAAWPQDELLAGSQGIVKPSAPGQGGPSRLPSSNLPRPGKVAFQDPNAGAQQTPTHWTIAQRTMFGANEVAAELGLPLNRAASVARGGDTHVIQRPDGQQAAFFSAETVQFTARTHGLDASTDQGFLRALGITMKDLRAAGVPLENIAPVGQSDRTYGQVLGTLTPAQRREIDPQVLARFEERKDLPLPKEAYRYHADVTMFTGDGKTMFVSEDLAQRKPALERQLQFFGYQTQRLPGGYVDPDRTPGEDRVDGATFSEPISTSYMNMVTGRDSSGRQVILMPTQALNPDQLTADDARARDAVQQAMPDARIIPIGGRSALTGRGVMGDGYVLDRDWGTHCMSNVLPYLVAPR